MEFLKEIDFDLKEILQEIKFEKTVKSSYAPTRLEKWYGYGSNLQSVKDGNGEIKWVKDFPLWLEILKEYYFTDANSALLCYGKQPESDTSIENHRDHQHFENTVVMINVGEAIFYVHDYDKGTLVENLKTNDVVKFDSKLMHKSTQTSEERWIITFRKVRKEFLKTKLF